VEAMIIDCSMPMEEVSPTQQMSWLEFNPAISLLLGIQTR
jgi:hypothetical protein